MCGITIGGNMSIQISGPCVPPNGSVTAAKIGSGNAGDGQVLTADGAGGAAWEAAANALIQGGNSFGEMAIIGTNDAFGLAIETGGVERARISANGNFGIGTANPQEKFEVSGGSIRASGPYVTLLLKGAVPSDVVGVQFRDLNNVVTGSISVFNSTSSTMTLDAIDSIRLQINSNEKMRVASSGNVGIQTTNPTAALHVPGSTTARASLRVPDGVAPTTPNDGDIWAVSGHLYARLGGVTKEFTLT